MERYVEYGTKLLTFHLKKKISKHLDASSNILIFFGSTEK